MISKKCAQTAAALLALVAFAGCGGSNDAVQSETTPSATPLVVSVPTFSFTQPTAPPAVATAAATLASTADVQDTLDPQAVERGRGRYEALECAACHGENGEGTDDGSPLVTYTASEQDFVTFMRSGGTLGAEHQYATNRLSATGAANLYQYLVSLQMP